VEGASLMERIGFPALMAGLYFCLASITAWASTAEEADAHYRAQEWESAEQAYRSLSEQSPENVIFKYRLAVSLRHLGKFQAAEMWLDEAQGGVVPEAYIEAERARLLATKGDRAAAFRALELAAEKGFPNPSALESDKALQSLATDPRFAEIIETMNKNRVPCEYIPEFQQFDFWLGNWQVLGPDGSFQGTNRIEKTQGGCLVLENWQGAGGSTGTSMNFYDPHAGEWVQVWVSPAVQLTIRGGIVDGSMVLTGHVYYVQNGDRRPFRGTWTPLAEGVVRQHFEESQDGGQTWKTWFDGYYHPVEPEAADRN